MLTAGKDARVVSRVAWDEVCQGGFSFDCLKILEMFLHGMSSAYLGPFRSCCIKMISSYSMISYKDSLWRLATMMQLGNEIQCFVLSSSTWPSLCWSTRTCCKPLSWKDQRYLTRGWSWTDLERCWHGPVDVIYQMSGFFSRISRGIPNTTCCFYGFCRVSRGNSPRPKPPAVSDLGWFTQNDGELNLRSLRR